MSARPCPMIAGIRSTVSWKIRAFTSRRRRDHVAAGTLAMPKQGEWTVKMLTAAAANHCFYVRIISKRGAAGLLVQINVTDRYLQVLPVSNYAIRSSTRGLKNLERSNECQQQIAAGPAGLRPRDQAEPVDWRDRRSGPCCHGPGGIRSNANASTHRGSHRSVRFHRAGNEGRAGWRDVGLRARVVRPLRNRLNTKQEEPDHGMAVSHRTGERPAGSRGPAAAGEGAAGGTRLVQGRGETFRHS